LLLYEQLGTIERGEDLQTGLGAAFTLRLRLREDVSLPDHDRVRTLGATHEEIYIDKKLVLPVGWAIYTGETSSSDVGF